MFHQKIVPNGHVRIEVEPSEPGRLLELRGGRGSLQRALHVAVDFLDPNNDEHENDSGRVSSSSVYSNNGSGSTTGNGHACALVSLWTANLFFGHAPSCNANNGEAGQNFGPFSQSV